MQGWNLREGMCLKDLNSCAFIIIIIIIKCSCVTSWLTEVLPSLHHCEREPRELLRTDDGTIFSGFAHVCRDVTLGWMPTDNVRSLTPPRFIDWRHWLSKRTASEHRRWCAPACASRQRHQLHHGTVSRNHAWRRHVSLYSLLSAVIIVTALWGPHRIMTAVYSSTFSYLPKAGIPCAILTKITGFMRVLRLHNSAKFSLFSLINDKTKLINNLPRWERFQPNFRWVLAAKLLIN